MAEIVLSGEKEFQARLKAITDTRKSLGLIGLRAVAISKGIVHRRTGNLARTIRLGTVTDEYVEVLAGGRLKVGYAKPEELGHRRFYVRPKTKKAMAWGGPRTLSGRMRKGGKATSFSRGHWIPARKGHPYLVPGIAQAAKDAGMQVFIRDPWNKAA